MDVSLFSNEVDNSMSSSDNPRDDSRSSRAGRHTPETSPKFWRRVIAGGSLRSLRGVGGALAVASAGAVAAAIVGGLWYLTIGDLLGDRGTAATTAIAGAVAIWLFIVVAGVRATVGSAHDDHHGRRRRNGT